MKEKFTPGPWIALESHPLEGSECYWIKCQPSPVLRGFVQEIGTVNGPQSGSQKANAHLIAAAPELYKALDAAKNALRSYQYGNASPELAEAIADMADKALAKAGGRP